MASLYEIECVYQELLDRAEENDGDITEVVKEFKEVEASLEDKAENYWRIIRNLTVEAEGIKAEKLRLANKQKQLEKLADKLKEEILNAMGLFEKDKLKTKLGGFSTRINTSLKVLDETLIPEQYFKVVKEVKTDDIKKALKNGEDIPGVEINKEKGLVVK